MINTCPVCGNDAFDTLQTRRGKGVYFSNGHPLGADTKRGRTLEIACSKCKARVNDDFTPFKTVFAVKDGQWKELPVDEPCEGYALVTSSKDEMTRYLLSKTKEA